MAKVLVLGAYGLLGTSLSARLEAAGYTVVRQGRRASAQLKVEPTDPTALQEALAHLAPAAVVNLAALTDVDRCEKDPQAAYLANVRPVEAVAQAIAALNDSTIHLVQISTDQVYDGTGPHREADARPCNVYALSKYAGELAAARVGATVMRTNLFGRSKTAERSSLSDWLVSSLRADKPVTVFDDVLFSPLHLDTLSDFIGTAIEQRPAGVFNVGCRGGMSKAQFALRLATRLSLDARLMTIGASTSASFSARRPLDMRMDLALFERQVGITAPTFDEQITLAAQEYQHAST